MTTPLGDSKCRVCGEYATRLKCDKCRLLPAPGENQCRMDGCLKFCRKPFKFCYDHGQEIDLLTCSMDGCSVRYRDRRMKDVCRSCYGKKKSMEAAQQMMDSPSDTLRREVIRRASEKLRQESEDALRVKLVESTAKLNMLSDEELAKLLN